MAYWKLLVWWCVSARTSGIFASGKQTTSVANPKVGGAVLRSSAGGGLPGRFHHPGPEWPEPARHGASAPCLGAAWGSLQESNIDDRVHIPVMRERHLPHLALGSVFSFALSALKSAIREGQQRKWHPYLTPMARAGPSRSIGPLPGGSKFFKVITGVKFLAPCIGKPASKSVAGRISRCRCRRCPVSCSKRTALAPR